MSSIILAVAPTGPSGCSPANPISPQELHSEVRAAIDAGASLVHMHSRDRAGALSADTSLLAQTVEMIKAERNFLFEASTGGLSDLSAEERARPVSISGAELGSLNLGSLNFGDEVYRNSVPDIRMWIETMRGHDVHPSLEVFDTSHLQLALELIREGLLAEPHNFSFIFNVRWGMRYSRELLDYLRSQLPPRSNWGCIFVGHSDFSMHLEAAGRGARVLRAGFEDSVQLEGRAADSNAALVRGLAETLKQAGYGIADVDEAREVLLGQ